jgi:hypothetical protein
MKIIAESCRAVCVEIDNNSMLRVLPRIKVKESEKWIKHVRCDGARFHVLSYYERADGTHYCQCSEPDCIINKPDGDIGEVC